MQVEVSGTMRAGAHSASHANSGHWIGIAQGYSVRRLTPRECERLQGFPDGYTLIPHGSRKNLEADEVAYLVSQGIPAGEAAQMAADGPRYKALGNSMAVNVMHWICRRIEMVDAL